MFAAILGLAGTLESQPATQVVAGPQSIQVIDSALFSLAAEVIRKNNVLPLSIDLGVLPPDPTIASVVVVPIPHGTAISRTGMLKDSVILRRRLRDLARLRLASGSLETVSACGDERVQASLNPASRPAKPCLKGKVLQVAQIAVPREGGAYLPGTVDERQIDGPGAFSVRAIIVELHEQDRVMIATDLVFRRKPGGGWIFVRMRHLVIVD